MEQKNALVNCLSLININSQLKSKVPQDTLIKRTLGLIKVPDMVSDGDSNAAVTGLKILINDLINGDIEYNRSTVLQKIRVYCTLDQELYRTIKEVLETEYSDSEELTAAISPTASQLHHFNNTVELRKLISRASYNVNNNSDASYKDIARELQDELAKVTKNIGIGVESVLVASVGSVNRKGITDVFNNTKKMLNGMSLKSGWKFLNRMTGINDGFVPGELWIMPALPHNAKTLFSLSLSLSFALFNDAEKFVPEGKKAMILDLSLENELEINLPIAYKTVHDHLEGRVVAFSDVDSEEAADYLVDKLELRGWSYQFERMINSDCTLATIRERFAYYESLGYHIVCLRIDYPGTMNKAGLGNGVIGSDMRELYRGIRNITTPRKCLVLAPHQLSPKAKEMKAMDPNKYVRDLPGKGYFDGCTTIDNEADGELYFGINESTDVAHLEVQRGKHRTLVDTPMTHRYRAIPFNDRGPLPFDFDTDKDYSVRSVTASLMNLENNNVFG